MLLESKSWLKITAGVLLAIGLISLYLYGARYQMLVLNVEMSSNDQQAYMVYTQQMVESNYTFVGGRNRMPVYPFIQSLFYETGMGDERFFLWGKQINIALSLILLGGLALITSRWLPLFDWVNLLLLTTFTVFIFKAGFFQVELLFYFLSFCLFLQLWCLLKRPDWRWGIAAGVLAGMTHLTKASVLPALALYFCLAGGLFVWTWWQGRGDENRRWPWPSLVTPILVGVFFLITVSPYIMTSKRVFGRYFYNVNSTFYMWYDSWGEVSNGTKAHGDRVGWPDMPAEEIPSLQKYLREHTTEQIFGRFVSGGRLVWENVVNSYGYLKYVAIYGVWFLGLLWLHRKTLFERGLAAVFPVLFVLGYQIGYLLLYFWYAPIASGNRFVLALFLPLIFILAWGNWEYRPRQPFPVPVNGVNLSWHNALHSVLLVIIAIDIYLVMTQRIFLIYGGR